MYKFKNNWVGETTLGKADGKISFDEGLKIEKERIARREIKNLREV